MQLQVDDAKFFKQCVDAIVNLVEEGTFDVSSQGLKLRSMDPSQIAMVDFSLPKEAFKKLEADSGALLGVNLSDLSKVLSRARSSESLTISVDEKEANKLELEFKGESRRNFKLPLLDLSASTAKELKIPFAAKVKVKGGAFKDLLKDAALLSSHVALEADENAFFVDAHGDAGDLRTETKKDTSSISELKTTEKARSMFPFEYLDDISRACPDEEDMSIELKTDAPVKISYKIGKAQLSYFLAPRVETI
ncbi:MAG: proliferating cell nuclear antigen (pcna) [Candidatus Micrarchaeia archaeon]